MRASAPGKIILFGEHAVVYGKHALVSAINLRCHVEAKKSSSIRITSQLGTTSLDFDIHPYVSYAIRRFKEVKDIPGVEIKIKSEIPVGSGLGSSAAVTVATLKALDAEFGVDLSDEDLYELARLVELDVQGKASGTDPFISTFGGSWLIPERERVNVPYNLFVINLGQKSTAEMVSKVAELRERHREVIDRIFDAIDEITVEASKNVHDRKMLEELISINQSLLRALGVSTPQIDRIISELEEKGIKAKITGAGGGGCIFGIADREIPFNCLKVKCENEGVRIEDS
jgi:mevalonate kinase